MLGRRNVFICRECRKSNSGNYFISETLCKECAAKRQSTPENTIVQSPEEILLTSRMLEGFQAEADQATPKTLRDHIAAPLLVLIFLGGFLIWTTVLLETGKELGPIRGVILFLLFPLPFTIGFFVYNWLRAPRKSLISKKVDELAKHRGVFK